MGRVHEILTFERKVGPVCVDCPTTIAATRGGKAVRCKPCAAGHHAREKCRRQREANARKREGAGSGTQSDR